MKRLVVGAVVAALLAFGSGAARAAEDAEYEDSITHPLRVAYHLVHPIGFAAEWLIGRPFHFIISRRYLDRFFGYQSREETGSFRRYGDSF